MLRPALYLIHVALFILFMFLYERIDTNFSQYVFLIGGDENFWIENIRRDVEKNIMFKHLENPDFAWKSRAANT